MLIHADVTCLPLDSSSVDAVLYIATLHNIKGRDKRLKSLMEIRRILKDDGQALISVWSRWQDKYRKYFLKNLFKPSKSSEFGDIELHWRQHGLNVPRFYHLYSKREFIRDLESVGFKIKTIQNAKLHSKKYHDNYFVIVS